MNNFRVLLILLLLQDVIRFGLKSKHWTLYYCDKNVKINRLNKTHHLKHDEIGEIKHGIKLEWA